MALQYSPKIVQDGLVMCLDPSQNKSYPTTDLPVKNGLVMWMDAADDTTFSYSSGTTVSQWRDKSGFNYHMVPKSSGPTRNAFLNSRKVLAFTTSQTIGNDAINLASSANTVFVVTRLTGTTNGRVLTCNLDSGGNNWLLGHHGGTSNAYYAEGWVYDSSGASTSFQIYMGDWSGSSTDLANFYINGTAYATNNTAASAGPNKLGINYYSIQTSTCEAAEIIVFNRLLSTAERKLVHTYLGQKWGILNTDRIVNDLTNLYSNTWLLGDGTTANMPQYSIYNKSFAFDGSNDIITYPNALGTFPSYTFSFWARRNIEGKMALSSYNNATFYWFGDNSWAYTHGGVFGEKYYNKSVSIPVGSYGHYCVTYDGTAVRIYRNGIFEDSQATTGNAVFNAGLQLGKYGTDVNYMFNGDIANFLMYSRALSASEVAQNYESQKSRFANYIVTNGLVLNLDAGNPYSYAGAGTTWYDVSTIGNNSTLSNGPTYNTDVGGNIVFDGVDDYVDVTIPNLTTTVTLDFWVKYTNLTSNMIFGFFLYDIYGYNGSVGFNTTNSDVYGLNSTQVTNLGIIGNWRHMVFVMRSDVSYTNNKIYVNGIVQTLSQVLSSENAGVRSFNSGNGRISGWRSDNGYKLPGSIGSFKAYNRELSAAEVLQNYNATKGRFGL